MEHDDSVRKRRPQARKTILYGSTTVHTSGLANVRVPKDFVVAGTTEQQICFEHDDSVEQDPAQAGKNKIT